VVWNCSTVRPITSGDPEAKELAEHKGVIFAPPSQAHRADALLLLDDSHLVEVGVKFYSDAVEEDEVVLALTPEEATTMLSDRTAGTISAKERAEFVRVLSQGQNYTRYSTGNDGKTVKEEVFVFYSAVAGPLGSLFWSTPGKRIAAAGKRFPVHAMTEYVLGNTGSPSLKTADKDRAISLRSEKFVLNLEASSPSHLTALICAFHALKSAK